MKNRFLSEMNHQYSVGDKVRIKEHHRYNGAEGEITALVPWVLVSPGYDVKIGSIIVVMSERSLERIEVKDGQTSTEG